MRRVAFLLFALVLPGVAAAEDAWTTRAVDALRWPGQEVVSVRLEAGSRVVVVVRDDTMVRVRHEADYGWVPLDALSAEPPADLPPEAPAAPDDPPAEEAPARTG
ncbi:MAG: hypothetical protein JXB39_10980 [Deltaproteobacteria bacterium]|nr:hypothetical protein [Deltaproteobacteria bacterium]